MALSILCVTVLVVDGLECVVDKDRTFSLRCTEGWIRAAKSGAEVYGLQVGLPVSTNVVVELALVEWLESRGFVELADLARGVEL